MIKLFVRILRFSGKYRGRVLSAAFFAFIKGICIMMPMFLGFLLFNEFYEGTISVLHCLLYFAGMAASVGVHADGAIDLRNNRIVINPEAKSRSAESILLHELTHAVYNRSNGVLTEAEGVRSLTTEERNAITEPYKKIGITNETVLKDELNAHYAERTLTNKNVLERLAQKKPTLKEKILGFFTEARTGYKSDSKLTGAANRLYRQYKKLFDEFSARNQRYLGMEDASAEARAQAKKRFSIQRVGERDVVFVD